MDEGRGQAPCSREEVDLVLRSLGYRANKRFGQHFLVSRSALSTIIESAEIEPGAPVLEVGPGLGVLTAHLLSAGARVTAIEIDRGFCSHLRSLFRGQSAFTLIEGDVMARKSALAEPVLRAIEGFDAPWTVVANLPYQISSPFLVAIGLLEKAPKAAVVMVQKEVARALRARPSSDDYSPLSFLSHLRFDVRQVLLLGPASFHPRPAVDSAVVRLVPKEARTFPVPSTLALGRLLFRSRRKQIVSSLGRYLASSGSTSQAAEALLGKAGIPPTARIEDIEPERIEDLARFVQDVAPLPSSIGPELGERL